MINDVSKTNIRAHVTQCQLWPKLMLLRKIKKLFVKVIVCDLLVQLFYLRYFPKFLPHPHKQINYIRPLCDYYPAFC